MFMDTILNDIDNASIETELHVIESFVDMFDKYSTLYDNCKSYDVFTESAKNEDKSIKDQLKESSKNDSNKFVSIIAFIPRLIKILVQTIKNKLLKTKIGEAFKSLSTSFKKSKNADEKRQRVNNLNDELKARGSTYEFFYDEEKDKIRLKKSGKRFLAVLGWLASIIPVTFNLADKISNLKEGDTSAVIKLKNDLKTLITKQGKVSPHDVIDDSIDSISETLALITNASAELTALSVGASGLFGHKKMKAMTKDDPDEAEKNSSFYNELEKASSYFAKIVGIITTAIGSLGIITDWGDIIKKGNNAVRTTVDELEMASYRVRKKGYANEQLLSSEYQELLEAEKDLYKQDVERATKEILESKNKEDTPENRKKYVAAGDVEDKIEDYLKEERRRLDKERADKRKSKKPKKTNTKKAVDEEKQ